MKRKATVLPFRTSREHLAAELEWLDRALLALVESTSAAAVPAAGHGWFVSTEEVERLLRREERDSVPEHTRTFLRKSRLSLVQRKAATERNGIDLALAHLSRVFGLSRAEELLVLACMAADTDDRYNRIYGYLHDDLTRGHPSIQLMARLAGLDPSVADVDILMGSSAPVFKWEIVFSEPGPVSQAARGWLTDPRIVAFLLGQQTGDRCLQGLVQRRSPGPHLDPVPSTREVEDRVWRVVDRGDARLLVAFHGSGAADGAHIAQRICKRLGVGLLEADLARLLDLSLAGRLSFEDRLHRLARESLIQRAALYLTGADQLRTDPCADSRLRAVADAVRNVRGLAFVEGNSLWLPGVDDDACRVLPIHIPAPSYWVRREMWAVAFPEPEPSHLDTLAARYRFTTRQLQDVVRLAGTQMQARQGRALEYTDVVSACRTYSRTDLDGLARTEVPRARWEDLVLPGDVLQQLRDICAHSRERAKVLHEWGFDATTSLGKGVYALFVGPSGTGKTLAAEVMATALGSDLTRVDLSAVVSKYIGETEKNLERIFRAAERSDAILFFDEADALFGKRSEVQDAHDRYANIEVSYLLQRVEAYEGMVILASNLAQNMDEAFTRRLHFIVQLPFPDERARLAIWQRHIPPDAPLADDIDLLHLARAFKITGGNIRNIVLNAAFLAADDGRHIGMRHVLRAARREFERLGKPFPCSGTDGGVVEACA